MPGRRAQPPRRGRETRWIDWIRKVEGTSGGGRLALGVGDDAAIWTPRPGNRLVLTVDVQVEGVHFRRAWLRPREIGRRAVTACLSDLAAMAATPGCVLVSVVAGDELSDREFRELYRGIRESARSQGAAVAGGNISTGPFSVSITGIGEGKASSLVRRSGARPGDSLWVTGSPGLAHLGLQLLTRESDSGRGREKRPAGALGRAERAFRRPTARIPEALEIARKWQPTSMIDLSDGLSTDIGHILLESARARRSAVGAILDEECLLALPGLKAAAGALEACPLEACLGGGDDYELAFTTASRTRMPTLTSTKGRAGVPVTSIGQVTDQPGLWLRTSHGELRAIPRTGWEHG